MMAVGLGEAEDGEEMTRDVTLRPPHYYLTVMHHVQVNQGKFKSICMVESTQSRIDEIQGVAWRVIHHRICAVQLHMQYQLLRCHLTRTITWALHKSHVGNERWKGPASHTVSKV